MGFLWANKQIKAKYTVAPELLRGLCVPGKTPEVEKCSLSLIALITSLGRCTFLHEFILIALELPCSCFANPIWPRSDSFLYSYPPRLFDLIPLYTLYLLPPSLVSSLPTLHDRVIQPEQYGSASCSRRCSAFPHVPPPESVRALGNRGCGGHSRLP